jgi:hypothetical protein
MLNIAPDNRNFLTGGVTFWFQPNKAGSFIDFGHLKKNSAKYDPQRNEFYSARTGIRRLVNSWATQEKLSFGVSTPEAQKEAIRMALLGSAPTLQTQAAGDVAAENVTAKLDRWCVLANQVVSSVVVKDSTDTTTYVLNTDYQIDAESGAIRPLSTGNISADAVLHVSYHKAALTALHEIKLLQASRFTGDAYVIIRTNNGHVSRKYIPSVEIMPDGDFDLGDGSQPVELSFTVNALFDATQATGAEYGKWQELVAAVTSA